MICSLALCAVPAWAAEDDEPVKIGVSLWFTGGDMGKESRDLLEDAAKVLGVELEFIDHEFNPEIIGTVVQTFIDDGCDGIIFNNPSDMDMDSAIDLCDENGVYLVQGFHIINAEESPEIYEKAVASEYAIGGVHENEPLNGENLVNILLDNGHRNIGLVGWMAGDALWEGRLVGYKAGVEAWNEAHPDDPAVLFDPLYSEGSEEKAEAAATELMETYPELDALIGEPIQGILSAIEKAGRVGEIGFVATDFLPDLGERLENGSVTGQAGGHYSDPLFALMLVYNAIRGVYTDIAGQYVDVTSPYLYISSVDEYETYKQYFVDQFPYSDEEIAAMAEGSIEDIIQAAADLSVQDAADRAAA